MGSEVQQTIRAPNGYKMILTSWKLWRNERCREAWRPRTEMNYIMVRQFISFYNYGHFIIRLWNRRQYILYTIENHSVSVRQTLIERQPDYSVGDFVFLQPNPTIFERHKHGPYFPNLTRMQINDETPDIKVPGGRRLPRQLGKK